MRLLIDTADVQKIREIMEYFPISGVTTNPSILYRAQRKPLEVLKEIREITSGLDMHVQVIGTACEEFIDDAMAIREVLGEEVYAKIPSTKEGFKAMKQLKTMGYPVMATAVYYPGQALIASSIGVDYIAPYFNRICREGRDGIAVLSEMKEILKGTPTRILAASFKTLDQVIAVGGLGVDSMTLAPDLFTQLTDLPVIDEVTDTFNSDFHKLTGTHSSLKDTLKP